MRTKPDGPELVFKFQRKAEEVTRLRMLWVPPNLHLDAVRRLAESVFGPEVTVERPNERRDLSRIDVTMPIRDHGEIPYNKRTEFDKTEEALIMVSVKGRKLRCYHCHSLDHWPNMCRNKLDQRMERTLGRRVEPAASGVVPGVSYAKIAKERKAAPSAPPAAPPPPPPPRPNQKKAPASTPKKTSGKQGKNDSPISPPPKEKKGTEVTVAPVIIPVTRVSPRKKGEEQPTEQKEEKKYAKEEVEKNLGSAKKKAMEGKDPMMAGIFTEASNKRKAEESTEKEEKHESKTRNEEARARSKSKSRETYQASPQKETN